MTGDQVGIVLVGVLSLLGAIYSARSARRTNTVTVDVRIFEALQEDVVRLQDRVDKLRESVRVAEDETDAERKKRRAIEAQVESLADVIDRMTRAMTAAGLPVPEVATAYSGFPGQPGKGGGHSGKHDP